MLSQFGAGGAEAILVIGGDDTSSSRIYISQERVVIEDLADK
jgi:hypothetical protein